MHKKWLYSVKVWSKNKA